MVTVPGVDPAITKPEELTVAIDVLLEVHETERSVAFAGNTVALNCTVCVAVVP